MLKQKVAAPWVLSMLASLHWRIVGKPRLALDCLQLALENVPKEFKDVPLVSIASIHHKVGLIDDALRITDKALQINAVEVCMKNIIKFYIIGKILFLRLIFLQYSKDYFYLHINWIKKHHIF